MIKKGTLLSRLIRGGRRFSTVQVSHTPDPHNTTSHVFNFTPENETKVQALLNKYPSNYKRSAVIPVLFIAQEQNGNFLSLSAMNKVAEILEVPPMDVYEVASFYTMFNRTRVGRFHLQVCGTTPCMVRGAEKIIKALEDHLGIHLGETTPDMLFTISEVECLGACANAPMLQVNNQWVYEDLDESNVVQLIEQFRAGQEVKRGPQNHRKNSEGPLGRTSLKDVEWVNGKQHKVDRDFKKAKEDWEKAKAEEAAKAQAQAKTAPPPPPPAQPPKAAPMETKQPETPAPKTAEAKTDSEKTAPKQETKEQTTEKPAPSKPVSEPQPPKVTPATPLNIKSADKDVKVEPKPAILADKNVKAEPKPAIPTDRNVKAEPRPIKPTISDKDIPKSSTIDSKDKKFDIKAPQSREQDKSTGKEKQKK